MKLILRLPLLLILLSACLVPLAAEPVLWTLENVTFGAPGGSATGSFVWDNDTSSMTDVSIQLSGITPILSYENLLLQYSQGAGSLGSDTEFIFSDPPNPANAGVDGDDIELGLYLGIVGPVPDGGSVALDGNFSFDGICEFFIDAPVTDNCFSFGPVQHVISGSLDGTPVTSTPEVSTAPALGLGPIGMVALGLRRRFSGTILRQHESTRADVPVRIRGVIWLSPRTRGL